MHTRIPKTYFSTPLSGSAREAEARIRNIFQGQKKRPALFIMVLAALLILLCGSLVAFRPQAQKLEVTMQLQYYDQMGNYIEIPLLQSSAGQLSQDAQAVNSQLSALAQEYRSYLAGIQGDTMEYRQCLLYPSTTQRYLNLVLYSGGSAESWSVRSWTYDLQKGRLVSLDEALALAGLTQEELLASIPPQRETYIITSQEIAGFRIRPDGQADFYLLEQYYFDGGSSQYSNLYRWSQGECAKYNYYYLDTDPLVPLEDCDLLSPALCCRWLLADEEPEGGFTPLYTSLDEDALTHLLFLEGNRLKYSGLDISTLIPYGSAQLLFTQAGEGVVLGAASFDGGAHVAGLGNLVVGLFDAQTLETAAGPFARWGDDAELATWTGSDGAVYLLGGSTGTTSGMSFYSGPLLLRFDGRTLEEVTALPAQASYTGLPLADGWESQLLNPEAGDFWDNYLAVPFPGGADLFLQSPDYTSSWPSVVPQWQYQGRLILDPQASQAIAAAPAPPEADGTLTQMILDHYNSISGRQGDAYLPQSVPAQPQEGDRTIQSILPVVSYPSYETLSGFYLVHSAVYSEDSKEYGQGDGWFYQMWEYVLVDFSPDLTLLRVRDYADTLFWDGKLWSTALASWPDVRDADAALWRQGYPFPVGFGSTLDALAGLIEETEPTPEDAQIFQASGPGVSVTYFQSDPGSIPYVQTVEVTRSDFYTRRGIRVGSARTAVQQAYSGLREGGYSPEYEGQDYLWYCRDGDGQGPGILFFFENDAVSRIVLT